MEELDVIATIVDVRFYTTGGFQHVKVYMAPPGDELKFHRHNAMQSFLKFYNKTKDVFIWNNIKTIEWILKETK